MDIDGGCYGYFQSGNSTSIAASVNLEKCFKEGKYSFTISVMNEALLKSKEISFEVDVTSPNCSSGVIP